MTAREAQRQDRERRVQAMYARYREGFTLEEVGNEWGIGKERVRQLFHLEGLPTRSGWESRRLSRSS